MAEFLLEENLDTVKKFKRIGISDQFADHYGNQASLMSRFGISTDNIMTTIKQLKQKLVQIV